MTANKMQYIKTRNSFWRLGAASNGDFVFVEFSGVEKTYFSLENEQLEPEVLTAWRFQIPSSIRRSSNTVDG